jgi:glyoxylase-like metal-dependent hydrolase (beta-lactamase superfamily II)
VRIALTHAHGDHIGSLDKLAAALPGVEVLITARDARMLAKDKALDPGEPQVKLRGQLSGREHEADGDVRARRPGRLARGPRRTGPHAGAGRVPRPARRDAVLR